MKRLASLLILVLAAWPVQAQAPSAPQFLPFNPINPVDTTSSSVLDNEALGTTDTSSGFLSGNHDFPNFINFITNPLQNIDPRAVSAVYPLFGSAYVSTPPLLPNVDAQVYGAALTVAASDRLAFGLNQGGYAVADFSRNDVSRILKDPRLANIGAALRSRIQSLAIGGDRDGFLNLGGFGQYTFIEDVPDQFLVTGGIRLETPCGSHELFQGYGPTEMAPYLTVGKEFSLYHILATTGYKFPIGAGSDYTKVYYANLHVDRQTFGWLYPLVELNYDNSSAAAHIGLDTRRGFIDFGNYESAGNVLSLAVGANAVIIKEKLELGAAYSTTIANQGNFDVNALTVKMVIRF